MSSRRGSGLSEVLKVLNLTVHFRTPEGVVRAVDGVDFSVRRGECLCIIGESGSGKSVLALSILRLLPKNAVLRGQILFEGIDLLSLGEDEMRRIRGEDIALIPQGRDSLNPVLTVGYQCAEPMIERGVDKGKAMGIISRIFEFLGISKRRICEYPHQMSGGMRQRALVAMGISTDPKLIIADEPTKGLDYEKRGQIVELFKKISDKTRLVITHDLRFAEKVCDRIAVMYCGKIVEICERDEFFDEPLHPYSKGLINALPSRGLKPIRGFQPSMINPPSGCRFRERCDYSSEVCKKEPPMFEVDGRAVRCWLYGREGCDKG